MANSDKSAFDLLLSDYLEGALKENLTSMGIKITEIHIDWFDDIKCIGVQWKYGKYYLDLQIYPDEILIAYDFDEPDEPTVHPLESKEQVYGVIFNTVKSLN